MPPADVLPVLPWQHRGHPALIAHRGDAARWPENTLRAISGALEAGAGFVEFDIQLSRDGVPVLLHDPTLTRTAGRDGTVYALDWVALRKIPVNEAARLGPADGDVCLPALRDAVGLLADHGSVIAFAEIKRHSIEHFGHAFVLDRVMAELAPIHDRCVVISFDAGAVRLARAMGAAQVGWALREWSDESRREATAMAPDYLFCNHERVGGDLWNGPWHWAIYEIDTPALASQWRARGATLIESMAPATLLAAPPLAIAGADAD